MRVLKKRETPLAYVASEGDFIVMISPLRSVFPRCGPPMARRLSRTPSGQCKANLKAAFRTDFLAPQEWRGQLVWFLGGFSRL